MKRPRAKEAPRTGERGSRPGPRPSPHIADPAKLESLRQAEGLMVAAMGHAMLLGWGDPLLWPARVRRSDGFEVELRDDAIDLAAERISALREQVGREIEEMLQLPADARRLVYRVLEQSSREEPEPPQEVRPRKVSPAKPGTHAATSHEHEPQPATQREAHDKPRS